MWMRFALCAVVLVAVLAGAWGCCSKSQDMDRSLCGNDLSAAASKTHSNFVNATLKQDRVECNENNIEIPSEFWAKEIQALKPIKVYMHRVNIVVVQKVKDGTEEGTYIYIPVSSYLPMSGDDGFEFSPVPERDGKYCLGNGVFDFKRMRK